MSEADTGKKVGIFAYWPNRITAVRFLGSLLLFVILAIWGEWSLEAPPAAAPIAFWLFILMATTDFLDGYLARRGNVVTAFGRIADPFVDKVLVLGTFIYLAVFPWSNDWVKAWMVVIVLAREFLVTGIRGYAESLGLAFPADWFGKIKMVVQCIAIGVIMGIPAFPWPDVLRDILVVLAHVFVWGTLLTSIGSGVSYVLKTRRLLSESSA